MYLLLTLVTIPFPLCLVFTNQMKFVYFLFSCIFTPISAQTVSDTLDNHQFDEITVRARRFPLEVTPAQTLSGKQLKRLNVHSVADAIRYFSGVQLKDYGGIGGLKTVNIRSMGTHHTGVFYDGIQLGNAQNGQIDLGRFSLDNMQAVSLYNGQRSTLFQPARDFASASAVYLETKQPYFEKGSDNWRITFKTGSFGTANPALVWEHKLNRNLSSSLSGEYLYTNGKYDFTYRTQGGYDTTATRKNGDVEAFRMEGGLFGRTPKGTWKAKAYLYRSERGLPGAIVRNRLIHADRQWDLNTFVQGSYRQQISSRYALLVNAKYAYDYLRYLSDPTKDTGTMYTDNRYHQQEAYLSVANRYHLFPWWDIALSTDYQWNKLNADMKQFAYPTRHAIWAALGSEWHTGQFRAQAHLLGTWVSDHVREKNYAESTGIIRKLTPAVTLSYQPVKQVNWYLRAFYKEIFRLPTLNDLYYTFIGNTNLEPETTRQYDLGSTFEKTFHNQALHRIEAQLDVYYTEISNKIVAVPTSNQFRWTMMNLGFVEIKGIDAALQTDWNLGNINVGGRLNYTYQKAQDFSDRNDPYYGDQIAYIPHHSGSAVLMGNWKQWELNYSFIYTGERYDQRANIPENYIPEWYTSDVSLTYTFRWKETVPRITLEVNNLFNQQFEVVKGYPMPGTNFKLILNLTI